ncbi:Alpha/Beta hydrolase protein [Mycena polygramma]|nr:Alpha/Beta hydrolase protein [Mycena polygramma]
MNPFLLPSLALALFLSLSLASPVDLSPPFQEVLSSEPLPPLSIPSSLYNEFDLYTRYSSAAYRYSNRYYRWFCPRPLGNTLVRSFEKGRTQGFIARDDNRKEIVVAFRGTFELKDFLADIKFRKAPFKSTGIPKHIGELVHVHRGFLDAYNNVVNDVLAHVKEELEDFPSYSIVVTGHSLGGAIAALAAPSIKTAHPEVGLKLYTFGQPRVGTPKFARYVEETIGVDNLYRAVHTRDIVPMVPKINYEHFGTEYWQYKHHIPLVTKRYETVKKCKADDSEDLDCSLSQVVKLLPDHWYYFGHVMSVPILKFTYCL